MLQDMVRVKREKQGLPALDLEKKKEKKIERKIEEEFVAPRPRISFEEEIQEGKNRSKNALWVVAVATVIMLFFAISTLFVQAAVTINPKTEEVVLNENFYATKSATSNGLSFDLMLIPGEDKVLIKGSGTEEVSNSAKGTVIIYNSYSSASQSLDVNTRLEGSNGKIYKTERKIVVPGKSSDGTPGKVEVDIYASEPGKDYNAGPLDFKIFGFKGSPKYEKFYGRSVGDISGGVVGTLPVVSLEEKEAAITKLKDQLKSKLLNKATNQIPAGFILYKDAVTLTVDSQSEEYNKEENAISVVLKGTLYGFLFKEADLTKKIAEQAVEDYDGAPVFMPKIEDLVFQLVNKDAPTFKDSGNISFSLSGEAKIVWRVDGDSILPEFLDKSKKDFEAILLKHENIDSADVSLRPFWKRSFPEKAKDITITVNYPNK